MNNDLISRCALLKKVQFRLPVENHDAYIYSRCVEITRELIKDEPSVDAVELPCVRAFDNGEYGIAYEVLSWGERCGFMIRAFKYQFEAEEYLRALKDGE